MTLAGEDFTLLTPVAVVSLASGASISVIWNNLLYDSEYHGNLQLQVDVNGAEGPNIVGRDLFYMELYSDGKVAETYSDGHGDDWASEMCAGGEDATTVYGLGCLTKIIEDGWVMDY